MARRKPFKFYIDSDLAQGLKRLKAEDYEPESVIVRRSCGVRKW